MQLVINSYGASLHRLGELFQRELVANCDRFMSGGIKRRRPSEPAESAVFAATFIHLDASATVSPSVAGEYAL
jgi:hypothetical protein